MGIYTCNVFHVCIVLGSVQQVSCPVVSVSDTTR